MLSYIEYTSIILKSTYCLDKASNLTLIFDAILVEENPDIHVLQLER